MSIFLKRSEANMKDPFRMAMKSGFLP